ncbi:ABC transporter ATP-binding protein/permease [Sporolactobacillus shoreicorticis]|uniref:ABC transporter ATP-binding protein n=1 Tax=Sporolactobacillus shoreicorticis TaxID=1923877 RepID=A0ABW5S388_9BACL|nr:ABC transporter ATP-binding protein [Sporolactobacillus shoreicorticis]MCO7127058.1 ABC transporter ATP-binding protein/permease [Sporolactobacillus shoreicorticis]
MNGKSGIARLFELTHEKKGLLVVAGILSVLATFMMAVPFVSVYFVVREIINHARDISAVDAGWMILWGWIALISLFAGIAMLYVSTMCSHISAFRILYQLRIALAEHLAKLPMGYHTRNTTGAIKKTLEVSVEKIENFVAHQLPDLVSAICMPLIMIAVMFVLDWRMALAALIPVIAGFMIQVVLYSSKTGKDAMVQYQDALENMNAAGVEYIRGMPAVKVFGMTVNTFLQFKKTITDFRDWAVTYTKFCRTPYMIYLVMLSSILTFILPVGIFLISGQPNNQAFALTLLLFLSIAPSLAAPMMRLLYLGGNLRIISEGVSRIDKIFQQKPIEEPKHPKQAHSFDIGFHQVAFAYAKKEDADYKPILNEVTFTAEEGTLTALVGPSGGGKSTIASLIPRFWDVHQGKITIGGTDIRDLGTEALMDLVSFVFQDVHLFFDTIEENIRMGNKTATFDEVVQAAKAACCHEFIMQLPDGYQTKIGEAGVYLSGGEEQRVAIARALLKNAPILVLDEATAYADAENEAHIQKAINALIKNKTVIMIAHRLSTIRLADQILVIKKGSIAERGTHDELLKIGGLYEHMWRAHLSTAQWRLGGSKQSGEVNAQ